MTMNWNGQRTINLKFYTTKLRYAVKMEEEWLGDKEMVVGKYLEVRMSSQNYDFPFVCNV